MTKPLISILIPFYNEEKYISRSLNSAINQTYENIEIILIDDFSNDNSVNIIRTFEEKNSKIKLISSNKKGVGAARNTAVSIMKGEFFTFLDADDALDVNFLETCFNKMSEKNCDIVVTNTKVFDPNLNLLNKFEDNFEDKLFINQSSINELYCYKIIPSAWGKLFNTKLINGFKFPESIFFEDKPFIINTLLDSFKVCVISDKLYFHYSHNKSITRKTINEKRIDDSTTSFLLDLDILSAKSNKNLYSSFLKEAFQYQLKVMLDIFFIIHLDKKKIDWKNINLHFQKGISTIKEEIKFRNVNLSIKNKILINLLSQKGELNAKISFFIAKLFKKKQLDFIKLIKT